MRMLNVLLYRRGLLTVEMQVEVIFLKLRVRSWRICLCIRGKALDSGGNDTYKVLSNKLGTQ